MVHLETLNEMRAYRDKHLKEWVREHPGEFVLVEQTDTRAGFKVSFYKSTRGLANATRKYEGLYGPTFVSQRIPEKYKKPWSVMNDRERLKVSRGDLVRKLRQLSKFEERSRKADLTVGGFA